MFAYSIVIATCLFQAAERPDPAMSEWLNVPTIGVDVCDYDEAARLLTAKGIAATKRKGVFITRVRPFSAADREKLKGLDLITAINGKEVDTAADFEEQMKAVKPKTDVIVAVKSLAFGNKGAIWKETKKVKLFAVENGRLGRSSVKVERDKVTGIGIVSVKPHPSVSVVSRLSLHFVVDQEGFATGPQILAHYSGEDWVFTEVVTVKAGDQLFSLKVDRDRLRKDVGQAGRVHEFASFPLDEETRKAYCDATFLKDSIVRFSGKGAPVDFTLSDADQWRMEILLDAYDSLKYGDYFKYGDN